MKQDRAAGRVGAFFERLRDLDAELVGEATTFLSYAQRMPLADFIATATAKDAELRARDPLRTPYYWWDLAMLDQYKDEPSFEWFQREFRDSVQAIGHTVLVLEWERPLPLERLWCIWEMFCSMQGARPEDLRFEVAMPPSSVAAFQKALEGDFKSLANMLYRIDLRNADAFHGGTGSDSCSRQPKGCPSVLNGKECPNERERILAAVEAEAGGMDSVNKIVVNALREWMLRAGRDRLNSITNRDIRASGELQAHVAKLLKDLGRPAEAEPLMRETAKVLNRTRGAEDPSTLRADVALGGLLRDLGKLVEAEALLSDALEVQQRTLGVQHADTIDTSNSLGLLLKDRGAPGDLSRAEALLAAVLAADRILGEDKPATLKAKHNLGLVKRARGDLRGAKRLFTEAFEAKRRDPELGPDHPSTLISMMSLGQVLLDRGDLDEAESLLRETLSAKRRALGDGQFRASARRQALPTGSRRSACTDASLRRRATSQVQQRSCGLLLRASA